MPPATRLTRLPGSLRAVVPGEYLITGVSGQRDGSAITAFLYPTTGDPGSLIYISNGSSVDNLLFVPPLSGPFSNWAASDDTPSGFVFETKDGQFNPFTTNGNTYEYNLSVGGSANGIPIQFSVVEQTPEPEPLRPLVLRDVADPQPGAGEVRLRVRCCAVCRTDRVDN